MFTKKYNSIPYSITSDPNSFVLQNEYRKIRKWTAAASGAHPIPWERAAFRHTPQPGSLPHHTPTTENQLPLLAPPNFIETTPIANVFSFHRI